MKKEKKKGPRLIQLLQADVNGSTVFPNINKIKPIEAVKKIKKNKTSQSFLYCTVHTWKGGADGHWGRK